MSTEPEYVQLSYSSEAIEFIPIINAFIQSLIPCGTRNVLRCIDLGTEICRKIHEDSDRAK